MGNRINNKYEYRSGLLDSLNVQHTASDVRNEDEYRKKILNGLGVEYTDDDINQKSLYRAKVVEGLASSGGGGETWNTVFEGNVTTEQNEFGMITGLIEDAPELTADELRITFNGVEFVCPKDAEHGGYGAPFNEGTFDWSEYPFNINGSNLVTQTAGTYSLKIEEPQSGDGSSDFSTAEVTAINNTNNDINVSNIIKVDGEFINVDSVLIEGTQNITAVLYKNTARWIVSTGTVTTTGSATVETTPFGTGVTITGDCTITIS